MESNIPLWLKWAREIQATSQTGLTFAQNEFEVERWKRLSELAAEMVADHSDQDKEKLIVNFLNQPGYATPKIDVRGAIIRDSKILLVKERTDECWCLPGGWVDVGESPSQAVVREVWEESGFKVQAIKVVAIYDANRSGRPLELFHAFKIIFLCEILGGAATASNETEAVDFFDFNKFPPLSQNRTNEIHLKEILSHFLDQSRETYFD